jgi:polyisoprenoid-binding protein YceI
MPSSSSALVKTMALPILPLLLSLLAMPLPTPAKTYHALKNESRLTYHLHHPLRSSKAVSKNFECSVEFPGDSLPSNPPAHVHARIQVSAGIASFNSGNANHDGRAMQVLEVYKHPRVEFDGDSAVAEGNGYRVFGTLNFHGVSRQINFPVTVERKANHVRVRGEFSIKLSDYKLKRPTLLWIPTAENLRIDLDVAAAEE